jgi:hypothetical protein
VLPELLVLAPEEPPDVLPDPVPPLVPDPLAAPELPVLDALPEPLPEEPVLVSDVLASSE